MRLLIYTFSGKYIKNYFLFPMKQFKTLRLLLKPIDYYNDQWGRVIQKVA